MNKNNPSARQVTYTRRTKLPSRPVTRVNRSTDTAKVATVAPVSSEVASGDSQVARSLGVTKPETVDQNKSETKPDKPRQGVLARRLKPFLSGHRRPPAIYAVVAIVVAGFIVSSLQGVLGGNSISQETQVLSARQGESRMSISKEEVLPASKIESYQVSPLLPRTLSVPALALKARVMQVGVNSKNQMQAPDNIFDTAWYKGSARPGETGAVVIDGYQSGPTRDGIFINISKLRLGDLIEIERGDGQVFKYSVVEVESKPFGEVNMNKVMKPIDSDTPGLNLITCDAEYQSATRDSENRVVVYARQI